MANIRKDSLRSWIVLFVVTSTMFLEIGTIKGFSVLLPKLKEQLNTHTWIVGSSIGIMTGFGYTAGVLSGALINVLGPRVCVMASGFIACLGLVVCSLATSPLVLLIGLILSGFLLIQETVVQGIVPDYFEKHYKAAVGIYSSGTALAILAFPLVTQQILETFGWRGALLLLSAVSFHSVPFGAILRPLTDTRIELETLPILDVNGTSKSNTMNTKKQIITQGLARKLGLHLLIRVDFVTRVFFPALILGYTLTGWLVYMVSFVISKGTSLKTASIVVTNGGIGMLIIRVGVFLFHKVMTYRQLVYISTVVMAACLTLMTVYTQLVFLNILSVVFGAAIGIFGAELYISAKMNSEESEHYHAIAWLNLAHGWASIFSGFLTGYLYDMTGSFTVSFNILAGASLLATLSFAIGDILSRNSCQNS